MDTKRGASFPTPEEHFKNVGLSLSFLRKAAEFTDLHFVCQAKDKKSFKRVQCHKAMFGPRSPLLSKIFQIANEKDPSGTVTVNLDGIDFVTMEKIIEYLYLGQTTVKKAQKLLMGEAIRVLGLDIELRDDKFSSSSSDSGSDECVEMKPKKKLFRNPVAKRNLEQEDEWKKEAEKKKSSVQVARLEECEDEETKKYVKKIEASKKTSKGDDHDEIVTKKPRLVKNPAVKDAAAKDSAAKGSSAMDSPAMDSADKGSAAKDLSVGNSLVNGSEVKDSGVKDKAKDSTIKKNPLAKSEGVKGLKITPENQKEPEAKPTSKSMPIKNKPKAGPASKINRKVEPFRDDTDVQPCNVCNVFLISAEALKAHIRKEHQDESSDEEDLPLPPKPGPLSAKKPGPKSKKKSQAIWGERKSRESIIGKVPSSDSESEDEKPKNGAVKQSSSAKKPGPSSRTKAKPGPKSKRRRSPTPDERQIRNILSSSEESENDLTRDPERKKPKIRISLGGKTTTPKSKARPLCLQQSGRGGGGDANGYRQCSICEEKYDKPANLRNHVLNHFKKDMMPLLTTGLKCPKCDQPSRDKITLLRHYAFSHKVIYEYCSEEAVRGKVISQEEFMDGGVPSKSKSTPLNRPVPKSHKFKARTSSSSSSSPSRHDDPKEELDKSESKDSEKAEEHSSENAPEKKSDIVPAPASAVVFSSDSDDGMMNKTAGHAVKSFDELFEDDLNEKKE